MADTKWPGMITLKNTKTNSEEYFFPIDARDLLLRQADEYVLVDDGVIQANRMNEKPFSDAATLGRAKLKEDKPAETKPAAPTPDSKPAAKAA